MSSAAEHASITRSELYDRVWSEPLSRVAKSLDLTDAVLRRRCRDWDIPIPEREYWKRKRNGHTVRKIALPPLEVDIDPVIYLKPPCTEKISLYRFDPDIAKLIEFEQVPGNKIVVPDRLTSPHPMTRATKAAMQSAFCGIYDRLRPSWDSEETLHLVVYKPSIPRALLLMDTLLKALRARGHETAFRRSKYQNNPLYEITLLE